MSRVRACVEAKLICNFFARSQNVTSKIFSCPDFPYFDFRNLPEESTNPLLASFKTRPTSQTRVETEAASKVRMGRPGFHCPAIAFHVKEEDPVKLSSLMKGVQDGTANKKKEIFYLLAENHNVGSHKLAYKRLKDIDSPNAKNFETFESYILTYPSKEENESTEEYHARLKETFKTVRFFMSV